MESNAETKSSSSPKCSRRDVLKAGGVAAVASTLAGVAIPKVHAAEANMIQLALIGCGGRGSGAVGNAIGASQLQGAGCFGPVKLVAMADVVENRLKAAHQNLSKEFGPLIDVPSERQFVGFDAYRKAIDCLKPGDVAMLTTHDGFRRVHLDYAVDKGVNVFMEKGFAPDPGGLKRLMRAGERAKQKNLKIAAGLMCRHSPNRQEMIQKIRDGALGEILMINAYRMDFSYAIPRRPESQNELLWQMLNPGVHSFLWASGGIMSCLLIHQIDECCWIKDAWPVEAHGVGGRVPAANDHGQNHHAYSMEFTFADGTKALVTDRNITGCRQDFVTYMHGTKCAGRFSGPIHESNACMYKDQRFDKDGIAWKAARETRPLHQYEWEILLDSIRNDKPQNEAERAAKANMVVVMGRAAVHSGQIITWDQAMGSDFEFYKDIDSLNYDSPAPLKADDQGYYPCPVPGQWKEV
jgi:predicted dehydrogenase